MEARKQKGNRSTAETAATTTRRTHYTNEHAFQEAWESLRFDRSNLRTTDQQRLRILHQGKQNWDQGPDFLDAEIQIGRQRHHGHVELHLHADDWVRHGHHRDPHYNAVVLHVFLEQGKKSIVRSDGTEIPGLFLGDRIGTATELRGRSSLACSGIGRLHLPADPMSWLEQAGTARLMEKSQSLQRLLVQNKHDWSQLLWEELAVALGGPVNGTCFRQLAQQIPWSLVRKYNYSTMAVEALLFGSCGALECRPLDAYHASLIEQWQFFQSKHCLKARPIPFKFHRMHPAGFPTVRIAQLASLLWQYRPIFQLLEIGEAKRFLRSEQKTESEYWTHRYEFGNLIQPRRFEMGSEVKERIVLNVLAPLAILYSHAHSRDGTAEAYLELLGGLAPEDNKVTRKFEPIGLIAGNALQTQGLIGIYRGLCSARKCLSCPVGSQAMPGRSCGSS